MHILVQTFEVRFFFFFFLEEVSYAHQGCIYLILNSNIVKILLHFKLTDFYYNIVISVMAKLCHMILQKSF